MHLITDAADDEPGFTKAVRVPTTALHVQQFGRALRPPPHYYDLGDGDGGTIRVYHSARLLDFANFYRGFLISYDPPPIPTRAFDYHATHFDYDGEGDVRHFCAESVEGCKHEIDIWHDEEGTDNV